jgi:hypothetical protein
MYVQRGVKAGRIARVRLSKTGKTIDVGEITLLSLGGRGYKSNYIDLATRDQYWVSGPRKDGQDTLYPGLVGIDEDAREEYWREIRGEPDRVNETSFRSLGVHGKHSTR